MIIPRKLNLGDTIGVVAPSNPIIGENIEELNKARKIIDKIFEDKNMSPKAWECFRSLYFENSEKEHEKIKCMKSN